MSSLRAALALLALLSAVAQAQGSACNHEIFVAIKFSPGKSEWVHKGKGTHFFGSFVKGQSLVVAGAQGTHYDAGRDLTWATTSDDAWELFLRGPDGFFIASRNDHPGTLRIDQLPATGRYDIVMGPCVDWGGAGTLFVSTSNQTPALK